MLQMMLLNIVAWQSGSMQYLSICCLQALFEVEAHQLERKKLRGCFLSQFPGQQAALEKRLKDSNSSKSAAEGIPAAENGASEAAELRSLAAPMPQHAVLGSQPASGQATSNADSISFKSADAAQPERVEMQSVMRGAEFLGLEPKAQPKPNLNAAAPEFRPMTFLPRAASQTSLSSMDGRAASSAGRAASLASEGPPAFARADSSARNGSPLRGCRSHDWPVPIPIPGMQYSPAEPSSCVLAPLRPPSYLTF